MLRVCREGFKSTSAEKNKSEMQIEKQYKSDKFQCVSCKQTLANMSSLLIPMKRFHKNIIRCKSLRCVTYFLTEAERNKHDEQVHKGGKWKKCIYCGNLFASRNSYFNHIKNFHKDKAIKCDFNSKCFEFFHSKSKKDEHILQVHKTGRRKVSCVYCGIQCRNKFLLYTHVNKKHAKISIKCRFFRCGLYFVSTVQMEEHFFREHQEEESLKKFQCTVCNFKTTRMEYLSNHVQQIHTKNTVCCPKCQRQFNGIRYLKAHLKYFHGKRIQCEHCGYLLIIGRGTRTHFLREFCTSCNLELPCVYLYKLHIKTCPQR